jgi:hypothetical protein
VGGNSVQVQELIGPEAENIQHVVADFRDTAGKMGDQCGIEGIALTEDPGRDLMGEAAIGIA